MTTYGVRCMSIGSVGFWL